MENAKTVYLIDGTAYIYRAFHAIRSLSNSRGMPTNAVFGFTRMLIKLMQDRQPEYAVMLFDAKGPTFRHERYPEYKANRPPMPEELAGQIEPTLQLSHTDPLLPVAFATRFTAALLRDPAAGETRAVVGNQLNIRLEPILHVRPDVILTQTAPKHFEPLRRAARSLDLPRGLLEDGSHVVALRLLEGEAGRLAGRRRP